MGKEAAADDPLLLREGEKQKMMDTMRKEEAADDPLRYYYKTKTPHCYPTTIKPGFHRKTTPPHSDPTTTETVQLSGGGMPSDKPLPAEATLEKKQPTPLPSHQPPAELRRFCMCLRWICANHANVWLDISSWLVFFVFVVLVPAMSHFVLSGNEQRRRYNVVVQVLMSGTAMLSFLCLRELSRKHDVRKFLALDRLYKESERIRTDYKCVLNWFLRLLYIIVVPCFAMEMTYKIWWHQKCRGDILLWEGQWISALLCTLELLSWIYRSTIFIFLCLLYTSLCKVELLRHKELTAIFKIGDSGGSSLENSIIPQYLCIRKHLSTISHHFRYFLLSCHLIVTLFPPAMLYLVSRHHFSMVDTIELALCSITILTGVLMSLYITAKLTNKTQSILDDAKNWNSSAVFGYSVHAESYKADPRPRSFSSSIRSREREHIVSFIGENKVGISIFENERWLLIRFLKWLRIVFLVLLSVAPFFLRK